ncbi:hypothetical protein F4810DRAFT_706718 [Camillea tinctor]|nr:hypothetical protein F4810DRAFT_706718 [Camillea tinctor]
MDESRTSERFLCRADRMESFCGESDLACLAERVPQEGERPIALIDDRKADGSNESGICRDPKGPLTPQQLHQELCRPRYTIGNTSSMAREDMAADAEPGLVDAERRLIYITDLEPATVLALFDTASYSQAYFLRDFIYNHLVLKPLLGVSVPIGPRRFALEFHLPYFAWRKREVRITDKRKTPGGKEFRRSQDLRFLDMTPSGTSSPPHNDYLYEAQMSCLVAGTGDPSWVAYGVFDTYHNIGHEESVMFYCEQASTYQVPMDPLSRGKLVADCPIWDPRSYFLRVLESRVEQVKDEWTNVVDKLQLKTCPYIQDHQVLNLYLSPDTENRGERLKIFYEWTGRTTRLLMELIDVLSKTIHAWNHFEGGDIEYFLDKSYPTHQHSPSYLKAIMNHFEDMKIALSTLQYQEKLESYLQLDNHDSTQVQLRTNDNVKTLTIVALVATIFSMPDSVLPGEPSMLGWAITTAAVAVHFQDHVSGPGLGGEDDQAFLLAYSLRSANGKQTTV